MLEETGLKAGKDFYLVFSPERVDPANPQYLTKDIPKVVGGIDKESTEIACALYGAVVTKTVPVSSTVVAEMAKLLENTFRSVNIGMVNELALMCHRMKIDVWEVIDAAKTKPFGFMPFYPGPGLGGHCIPIDPFYLSWKARQSGFEARFIELAGQVNSSMPEWVGHPRGRRAQLREEGRERLARPRLRRRLQEERRRHARVAGARRHRAPAPPRRRRSPTATRSCRRFKLDGHSFTAITPAEALAAKPDCVVITTDHDVFDYDELVKKASLIMDARNALKKFSAPHIHRL